MSIIPCSMPDCERSVFNKKRELCKLHYGRWYSSEGIQNARVRELKTFLRPAFTCESCGKFHAESMEQGKAKTELRFCDKRCSNAVYSRAERARRHAERGTRFCPVCNQDISSRKADAKFCSVFCSDVSRGTRLAKPLAEITCALVGCTVRFVPNREGTKCCSERHGKMHWNRVSRAEGRQANSPWNERRKAASQKRRAQKLGTQVEDIRPIDIYERDIWLCGLCLTPVDPDVSWPDPMSASLDHVLPLSKGGTHTYENVQLAHLTCNVSKGNRVAA